MTRQAFESLKVGDKVDYLVRDDFSGRLTGYYAGVVSAVENDHCIVSADGMNLWCDPSSLHDFEIGGGIWVGLRKMN